MTILLFVLALLGGASLGIAANTVRRMKNIRLLFVIGAGASLACLSLALTSDFDIWLSPGQGFLLGLVLATVLLDWGPFVLDKPSRHEGADSKSMQG